MSKKINVSFHIFIHYCPAIEWLSFYKFIELKVL